MIHAREKEVHLAKIQGAVILVKFLGTQWNTFSNARSMEGDKHHMEGDIVLGKPVWILEATY